jgi:hypothetical protein
MPRGTQLALSNLLWVRPGLEAPTGNWVLKQEYIHSKTHPPHGINGWNFINRSLLSEVMGKADFSFATNTARAWVFTLLGYKALDSGQQKLALNWFSPSRTSMTWGLRTYSGLPPHGQSTALFPQAKSPFHSSIPLRSGQDSVMWFDTQFWPMRMDRKSVPENLPDT